MSSWETFSCRNLKNGRMSFLGQCNVETVLPPGFYISRASPAQKLQGSRVNCSKNFSRATFFVFWVTYVVDSYLSYLPVKQI